MFRDFYTVYSAYSSFNICGHIRPLCEVLQINEHDGFAILDLQDFNINISYLDLSGIKFCQNRHSYLVILLFIIIVILTVSQLTSHRMFCITLYIINNNDRMLHTVHDPHLMLCCVLDVSLLDDLITN